MCRPVGHLGLLFKRPTKSEEYYTNMSELSHTFILYTAPTVYTVLYIENTQNETDCNIVINCSHVLRVY